ncbi:hypothetical protein Y032_0102g3466 [Ancylostoma ceylanicum]|nr:hypothetical protein Y032_0102g3466 [Ancylostoma ceylanicum]
MVFEIIGPTRRPSYEGSFPMYDSGLRLCKNDRSEASTQSPLCLCPRRPRAVPPLVFVRLEFTVLCI